MTVQKDDNCMSQRNVVNRRSDKNGRQKMKGDAGVHRVLCVDIK